MFPGLCLCLALFVVCLSGNVESSSCPNACRCIWRSSKITVECTTLLLRNLPEDIDTATQVLNFTGNNITVLRNQIFQNYGLLNLQRISLSQSNISKIQKKAFAGLLNLIELDLSGNRLTSVPSHIFPFSSTLMNLDLSRNPIKLLQASQFKDLVNLIKLDLSGCHLETIHAEAFTGLPNLERLHLNSNKLRQLPAQLSGSLHGVTLHDNPWNCDCNLRDLKHWLDTSNVPWTVDPVCFSPARLKGFKISLLSNPEFACVPSVSPEAMYLMVEEDKDVVLSCRVQSDPAAQISWAFNSFQIDSTDAGSGKFSVKHQFEGHHSYRSELRISNITASENGSYTCAARNKAGLTVSNFTVHVARGQVTGVLELRLEHFVVVSICVIVVLLILVIAVTLLLVHLCRKYTEKPKEPITPTHMPKYIQMGTGRLTSNLSSPSKGSYQVTPDILSEVTQFKLTPDSSCVSMDTVSTPASSDHADMSIIMKDYGNIDKGQPIIGSLTAAGRRSGERSHSVWGGTNKLPSSASQSFNPAKQPVEQPQKTGLRNQASHRRTEDAGLLRSYEESLRSFSRDMFQLNTQDIYPVDSSVTKPNLDSVWAHNNPYLHTSCPYIIPYQRLVKSDEQYPTPSLQYPDNYYNPVAASETRLSSVEPLYESINSVRLPPRNPTDNLKSNQVISTEDSPEDILRKLSVPSQEDGGSPASIQPLGVTSQISCSSSLPQPGSPAGLVRMADSDPDAAKDSYLNRFDSPDISKELETAFFKLDCGETEI